MSIQILAAILLPGFIVWLVLGERRLVSLDTSLSLGCLAFVWVGLALEPAEDASGRIAAGILFYASLMGGSWVARTTLKPSRGLRRACHLLTSRQCAQRLLRGAFVLICALPWVQILSRQEGIRSQWMATWRTNTVAATSEAIVEASERHEEGGQALVSGIRHQTEAVWWLCAGITYVSSPALFWAAYATYGVGTMLTAGGFRSVLVLLLLTPLALATITRTAHVRLRSLSLGIVLLIVTLLGLDWLRHGRQGATAEGEVLERLVRTVRTDVAYGGYGYDYGTAHIARDLGPGTVYLKSMLTLPLPRVLFPDKSTWNPNQTFTEMATGKSLEDGGNILLFTPLGEGFFVFGWWGLVIVPFVYGGLAQSLERKINVSQYLGGTRAQVWLWALLSMRLTLYNFYSAVMVGGAAVWAGLIFVSYVVKCRRSARERAKVWPKGEAEGLADSAFPCESRRKDTSRHSN